MAKVFEYVADPATMVEWLSSMMEIRDLIGTGAQRTEHGGRACSQRDVCPSDHRHDQQRLDVQVRTA
ncbi:MAG: hypothetical protein JRG93_00600 [Deltaproteobacteria bacterium]|nr:hypothetical protein [Deltaproteobacteria bacterium]